MTFLNKLGERGRRILMFFRRPQFDSELQEEMRLHRDLSEQEMNDSGMADEEVRYAARRQFGNELRVREESKDMWGWTWLENTLQDVRFGARALRKNPGFTAVALLSLGLGIGANSAIYSVTNAALLRSLPIRNPDEVMIVTTQTPKDGMAQAFSVPLFRDLQKLNSEKIEIAAYTDANVLASAGSQSERIVGELVSSNYFSTLGVQPVLGSTFSAGDDLAGTPHLAVISYSLWRRMFGGESDIVGKKVSVDALPFIVIGVAPRQYTGFIRGHSTDIWMTLPGTNPDAAADLANPGVGWLVMFGRLAPGVSRLQAQEQMTALLPTGYERFHDTEKWTGAVIPAGTGNDRLVAVLSRPLQFLSLATGLVLLIACANVANLLLSRGTSRRKEIALRLALGASRTRVVRQLFTESAMLAVGGAILGLTIAWWVGRAAEGLRTPIGILLSLHAGLDVRVLVFTLGCTVLAAFIFGIVPAWTSSRSEIVAVLKGSSESTGRRRWLSGRAALVTMQVALTFAMVVTASLFLRSLWKLQTMDLGFSPDNVLAMNISFTGIPGFDEARGTKFYSDSLEQLSALPEIYAAGFADRLPVTPGGTNLPRKPNQTIPAVNEDIVMNRVTVSPGFFRALNLPIVRGREFSAEDSKNGAPAIIVNETMAQKFWPGADPVGHFFVDGTKKFLVVGVARNTKYRDLRETPWMTIYRPLAQSYISGGTLLIRASGSLESVIAAVRARLQAIDPAIPVFSIRTLSEHIGRSLYLDRLRTALLSAFGSLALGLACVGLYGVMAFQVAQRTREIGIRMALGANPARVLRHVMGRALVMTFAGLAAGWLLAYWVARFAAKELFELQPDDPWALVISAMVLLLAASAAALIPARRAMRINPLEALRHE
jgi:macrolide transport system ATP-binding/permease protein